MKKNLIGIVVILGFMSSFAQAAVISVKNPAEVIQVGDVLSVQVVVDTQGKQINAASVNLIYTDDIIAFKRIVDGDSVINFWVEQPRLTSLGTIGFSGITPGGFIGTDIELLTLEFEVIKEGVATFTPVNLEFLLHDGLGTAASSTTVSLSLNVLGQLAAPSTDTTYVDTEAPEAFSPIITSDNDLYDGKMFLVFQTEDKASGIDFYEVKEGEFGTYEKAISPYELKKQSLGKKIFVRAVDRNGNEYVAEIYPHSFVPWDESPATKTVILVVCITAVLFLLRRVFSKSAWG